MRLTRWLLAGMALLGLGLAQEFITIGSGSTTGVYFPVATGMAKLVNDANVGIRANARSTGGSVANINAIAAGEFEMALAQNDIAYYAYQGCCIPAFEGKAVKGIRALAALYPEVIHIVARADAGIRTVADLKGKRVVVGDVGSGTEQNARQVLEAYGLRFEDLGQAIRVSATQGIQLMQDKRADALFYTVGLGGKRHPAARPHHPHHPGGGGPGQGAGHRQTVPLLRGLQHPGRHLQGCGRDHPHGGGPGHAHRLGEALRRHRVPVHEGGLRQPGGFQEDPPQPGALL
jgi:hypothetical protein